MENPDNTYCWSRLRLETAITFCFFGIVAGSMVIYSLALDGTIDSKWKEITVFGVLLAFVVFTCFCVFVCFDRNLPIDYYAEDEPSVCGLGRVCAGLKKCLCCCCRTANESDDQNNEPPTDATEELPSPDITESTTTDTTAQSSQTKEEIELATLSRQQQEQSVSTQTDPKSADDQETKL